MPFLSIIIPTFNSSSTLSKAVDSILLQDFNDYEIWIIDGKSTDTTTKIVEAYHARDKRVNFISEPDKGIYDAMNKGIDLAAGQWIYFIGSDDKLYANTVLSAVFAAGSNKEYDALYGNVYSTKFEGPYDGEFTAKKLYNKNICHQAIFLKKELFAITGNFDTKYKAHADWEHNIKWFLNPAIKKKYIDMIVADYAEGGFSSLHEDNQFVENKNEAFLISGKNSLDKEFRTLLLQSRATQMKNEKKFAGYLKYKLKSFISRYA